MKVLLTKSLLPQDIDYIQARVSPEVTVVRPEGFSPAQLVAAVGEADVVLGAYFSDELLRAAKKVASSKSRGMGSTPSTSSCCAGMVPWSAIPVRTRGWSRSTRWD